MPKKIFTEKEKEEIIKAYTIEKIGSKPLGVKYGCSAPTLLKNLKEWGIEANTKKLDLKDQKFGLLTAIKPAKRRDDRYTRWVCQCECGNITEVRTDYLTSGHTTSCGCEKEKHFKQTIKIGSKYGKLTPVAYDTAQKQYLCKCDCGNTTYVIGYNLTNGNTQSCGCLKSKGELKIITILSELGVKFKTQYSFEDCRFIESNKLAYFDFAILDDNNNLKMLIEYDGAQHETGWGQDSKDLDKIQKRDLFKQEFCLKNNIPLIRISYKDYDKLNGEYLQNMLNQ